MKKKYLFFKNSFLFSSVLFIGFSFEFFIRNDLFLGSILIFVGIMSLIAYQSASRRVNLIDILLNITNVALSFFVLDSYGEINFETLYFTWWIFLIYFLFVASYQIQTKYRSSKKKKRLKSRMIDR